MNMPDETPADRIATGLAKLGLAMKHESWRAAAEARLSPTQAQVLALLLAEGRPLRLQEVAKRLAITPATASDSVATLESKKLVGKQPSPTDARAVAISLTEAGRVEAQRAAAWPDFLLPAVSQLSEGEQAVLLRALVKMVRVLQLQGRIPVARMCAGCLFFQPNRYPGSDAPHHCGFVDAPFGDFQLRLDCADFQPAPREQAERAWLAFITT